MRVAQVGNAMNNARLSSEQRCGQDRQRGIFRAADFDRTGKRITAVDEDLIHTWQKGTVSRRYNRFLKKCRGNFFPPGPKEAPRSGQARFPRPTVRQVEAGTAPDQSARAPTHRLAHQRITQPPGRAKLRAKEYAGPVWKCKEDLRQ